MAYFDPSSSYGEGFIPLANLLQADESFAVPHFNRFVCLSFYLSVLFSLIRYSFSPSAGQARWLFLLSPEYSKELLFSLAQHRHELLFKVNSSLSIGKRPSVERKWKKKKKRKRNFASQLFAADRGFKLLSFTAMQIQ